MNTSSSNACQKSFNEKNYSQFDQVFFDVPQLPLCFWENLLLLIERDRKGIKAHFWKFEEKNVLLTDLRLVYCPLRQFRNLGPLFQFGKCTYTNSEIKLPKGEVKLQF